MSYFTFLTGLQPQGNPEEGNPEGWMVRRKGQDYWRPADSQVSPEDEIRPEDTRPTEASPDIKPYTQRRGETTSKVFATADKIIDRYASVNPTLAEQTKREIRAKPDDAAKVVEKFYEGLSNTPRGTAFSPGPASPNYIQKQGYDPEFTDLENNVRSLRLLKRGPEEKALTGQLAQTDLSKNAAELQSLRSQLDTLTKDIAGQNAPEAVSRRGEEENKKALAQKQSAAAALAEHISRLEGATNQAGQQQAQPVAGGTGVGEPAYFDPQTGHPIDGQAPRPDSDQPVTHFMESVGIPKGGVLPRVHAALNAVGIPQEQWGDRVEPSGGLMRVLAVLDPQGTLAQVVAQQMAQAKQEDLTNSQQKGGKQQQETTDPKIAQTQQAIQSKEQEMKALYAQLRETPFMQTWPGIILYVLVGMVTQNPAFAARLIGGVRNKAAVNAEIRGMQFDLRRLDHELQWREHNDMEMKREAARRLTKQGDEQDQRKWELSKMLLQHQLIIKRNAARGNPETFLMKKLSSDFQRNLGMAGKFQGTAQNEFADPKERAAAKANFDVYMRRAAEIDKQIRDLGGAALEEKSSEAAGE